MGIDERIVRAKFIQLLRQRTPNHPWVKQHDEQVRAAVAPTIDDLMATICAECPAVWQYSCACFGWCMRTGAALPEPKQEGGTANAI